MDQRAKVLTLRSRQRQERLAKLREARQLVLELAPKLSATALREIKDACDALETLAEGRRFVQLDPDVMEEVEALLDKHSSRPVLAFRILRASFGRLDRNSQEVLTTRAELAVKVQTSANNVSTALGDLERLKVIWREPGEGRQRRIFLNPRLATKLDRFAAEAAISEAPLIQDPNARPPRQAPQLRVVPAG